MKKVKKIVTNLPKMVYGLSINADSKYEKKGPYEDPDEAKADAERCMRVGVWIGNRLYPPHSIIFIELVENYVP